MKAYTVTAVHVEPLHKEYPPQAVAPCAAGINRIAGHIGAGLLDPPGAPLAGVAVP